jgi:metal-dependent amidase/aminoacylase/carboxypeptidase family protein
LAPQPGGGYGVLMLQNVWIPLLALAGVISQTPAPPASSLIELRRDLHRHPELSGQEVRTAALVAERLQRAGLDVRTGIGGTGVVAILTGGLPGPLVAYRADMDAVPSAAPDPSPYAAAPSGPAGAPVPRHICGHDLHVTIAVGLAESLASERATLPGRVMFIFQPAEERATGARAMLDAGLFRDATPVAIYGLHTAPFEVGQLSSKPDRMMLANAVAPGVVNDPELFARAKADLIAEMGAGAFTDLQAPPAGFSEDFGHYQATVPGVFFFIGASRASAGRVAAPHSPSFELDDDAIAVGVKAMRAVVLGRLRLKPSFR